MAQTNNLSPTLLMQDFGTSTGQAKIEKNKLMISEQLTIADNLGANGIVESLYLYRSRIENYWVTETTSTVSLHLALGHSYQVG